ncbi:MAG: HEAT repeat domain-containing protein, partial [Oligoflexia bacterium]|nr:HEAT repeat domain-containing protein [Oligoflexia bacterium]
AWLPGARARGAVRVAATRADLRAAALMALAEARDVAGYELAEQALSDQDPATRQAAAAALDRVGGTRAVGLLEDRLTQDDSAVVRQAAARALARVAPPERVRALLRQADTDLVCQALLALGEAGRAELAAQVSAAGSHPEAAVRLAATTALGMLAIPATTPRLLQLLLDEDVPVGLAALHALSTAGDSRAVRLLRLLAAHPGLPGQRATDVLVGGLRLRQPPPDSKVRILARSDHPLPSRSRARIAAAFQGIALDVAVGELGLAADGDLPPDDLDALADLVRAVATVDTQEPGLSWSIRDAQGLIRRRDGDWCLDARHGDLVRDAGWFRGELPHVSRVPLTAEITVLPPDPAADGALPVGLGDDELPDLAEDTQDDATEQTISGFLEEITGARASPEKDELPAQPDPDAAPPKH